MTDERIGDALWRALGRLQPGSGVVFRHYRTSPAERRTLYRRVRRIARARRLILHASDDLPGADGRHNGPRPDSAAAHDRRGAVAAVRRGAKLLFVSPVYATRSHPGAAALGPVEAGRVVRGLPVAAIALGGMNARRWRRVRKLGFAGWAAIDALTRDQKRNAVPRYTAWLSRRLSSTGAIRSRSDR